LRTGLSSHCREGDTDDVVSASLGDTPARSASCAVLLANLLAAAATTLEAGAEGLPLNPAAAATSAADFATIAAAFATTSMSCSLLTPGLEIGTVAAGDVVRAAGEGLTAGCIGCANCGTSNVREPPTVERIAVAPDNIGLFAIGSGLAWLMRLGLKLRGTMMGLRLWTGAGLRLRNTGDADRAPVPTLGEVNAAIGIAETPGNKEEITVKGGC